MKPLWTPWRMQYVLGIKNSVGCVFCEEVHAREVDPDLVIHRGHVCFVVLNLYPYVTGHLMIVPFRHVASMHELSDEEIRESTALLERAERALEEEYRVRRHHVGLNLGRCAGAGVEGHLHIHLVPCGTEADRGPRGGRSAEDMAEPLTVTRDRLAAAFSRIGAAPRPHSCAT